VLGQAIQRRPVAETGRQVVITMQAATIGTQAGRRIQSNTRPPRLGPADIGRRSKLAPSSGIALPSDVGMTAQQRTALAGVITIDKEIMHGTPCFTGTRVPVQTLIDFLEAGESIDDFLAVYPYIPRQQVHGFLELSKDLTIEQLSCASF
jgi:uncharacterized protein (DUF433 family)